MSQPPDHEERITALESRVERVSLDAAAARHLAAAHDRDLSDLPIKIDANRQAINALGLQTAGRFDEVDRRFNEVDRRFDSLTDEMGRRCDSVTDEMGRRFDSLTDEMGRRCDSVTDEMRTGFATMRAMSDQQAGGMQLIVDLLSGRGDDAGAA